ncbi:protein LOW PHOTOSYNTHETIC EFFICIENCY 1, chloroplastic [Humulus lupulus]|uniref:protein LOW PHOTOSYNTHETIC EFFICIENCY 1, chloroplastic n=1 Tax=Humulus lupulus TaxID=3486 RepID=UPI002B41613B|nr:protein LOW PHOTOSYNTHETIC EFFICIENCY 1, chloroplastic [Humulus lupulus]
MQALGSWPLKGDLWIVSELGIGRSSNNGRRRRKTIWGLGFSSLLANNSRDIGYGGCHGRSKFDLGCGFSKLKVARLCKPKKNSSGSSVALAWALEEQAIGSEFQIEEFNSEGTLSEKPEIDGHLHLSRMEDGAANNGGKEKPKRVTDAGSEGGNGGKVDVRELALSLQLAKTADDVDEVLKDKGELPLQVYSTLIRGLGKEKLLDSAFAVHEWLKRKKEETNGVIGPNLFIYNSLLGAVKQSEKYGEMEKILNDMTREGIVPNTVTYNTIMVIYLEKGQGVKALNILQEIQKKGLTPSPVSYSTALLAYRRMEDGNGALKFFVEIREKYQKGEIGKDDEEDWKNELFKLENFTIRICYQVMRRWLVSRSNLSTNVLKLLMAMDNAGIPPGQSEYERLLWACTREDHYLVAKELYDRIREKYFAISLSVCNHLIWLMGKAKKWWTALEIYEDLLDKGPKPNNMSHELIVSHFNVLLTAARKRGIWRWGIRLLNKMEEKGLKPGTKEWNAVLVACSKASETTAAVKIFKRMVEQGQKPTSLSYGALLSALEKGKLYDEARQVWEHMLKVGVEPNLYAYTIMASVFAGHGKFNLVETVLSEMNSSGIEPTVVTYNAIISGCARNDMSSAAFEWFHRMKADNIPPNNVSYEMLIEALARDSKPRLAYELYLKAKNEDFDISPKSYDIVVESSQLYGVPIDLRVLGPRPPDRKDTVHK